VRRRDGQPVPVAISAVSVRTSDGRVTGVAMIVEDISIRKDTERLREEWTAVVAHDLRQPVSVIALAADMLIYRHAGEWDEIDQRGLERIRGASRRLNRMISDLTEASLIESKQLSVDVQLVDMDEVIGSVLENLAFEVPGFDLCANVEGESWAWIDHERILQVLTNLVANAAKYGDPGTSIVIDVRAHDDVVEVVVTNRGPGITPDQMPLLFSRFSRTREARGGKVRGLGLGLYIAKGIVEAHGGRIWAESVPGETTSFHFTLRRDQPARVGAQPHAEASPSPSNV
jgi:signal transduction histidine kinase